LILTQKRTGVQFSVFSFYRVGSFLPELHAKLRGIVMFLLRTLRFAAQGILWGFLVAAATAFDYLLFACGRKDEYFAHCDGRPELCSGLAIFREKLSKALISGVLSKVCQHSSAKRDSPQLFILNYSLFIQQKRPRFPQDLPVYTTEN